MFFDKLSQIFKSRDLRNKVLFVVGVMIIFRLMANIPVPGIDPKAIQNMLNNVAGGANPLRNVFNMANILVGGTLEHLSILMLGMGPYITATIIMQLLAMVIPSLEEMVKEGGEAGKQKMNQYSRIAAVFLAAVQGWSMLVYFQRPNNGIMLIPQLPLSTALAALISIMAGSVLVMWLGELISEKGIGDGVSLLIFAGIVSRLPASFNVLLQLYSKPTITELFGILAFVAISLIMIGLVIMVTEARRNVPVSYAKHVRGNKVYGGTSTYLPLSVNPTGVIPIIFALSFLVIPATLFTILGNLPWVAAGFFKAAAAYFDANQHPGFYYSMYFMFVFAFTYFYAAVVFNPKDIADNLQKTGGFVPGIRPGEKTTDHINTILNRLLFIGAFFLGFIAIIPALTHMVTRINQLDFLVGGTSLLIMVSVVMDTIRKINAQLQMRDYEAI